MQAFNAWLLLCACVRQGTGITNRCMCGAGLHVMLRVLSAAQAIGAKFEEHYFGKEDTLAELKPLPTAVGKRSSGEAGGEDPVPQHNAITVLICRKRIQSRLLPGGGGAATLGNGNVLPGTMAAEGVLSALRQNFLLVSAAGIQGTSKPTEYVCVLDEIGFSPEALAMLTFWSCHTYGLCARYAALRWYYCVPPAAAWDTLADQCLYLCRTHCTGPCMLECGVFARASGRILTHVGACRCMPEHLQFVQRRRKRFVG